MFVYTKYRHIYNTTTCVILSVLLRPQLRLYYVCHTDPGGCYEKHGNYPHPDDCKKYINCYRGELWSEEDCQEGEYFHPTLRVCVTVDEMPQYCNL